MASRFFLSLVLGLLVSCAAPVEPEAMSSPLKQLEQDRMKIAADLARPISICISRDDTEHPAFHGCIDWHSAVHAAWALTAYSAMTNAADHEVLLAQVLSPERIAAERDFIETHPAFEMPYGRAWFLRLAASHERLKHDGLLLDFGDAVADSLVRHYTAYPPDPMLREYSSSSWALVNLLEWGRMRKRTDIVDFVTRAVREHFVEDARCPMAQEQTEWRDFMSVCATWGWLVSEVAPREEFLPWLARFMPEAEAFRPVKPLSAHHNGLNFSRAWGLWKIYEATGDERFLDAYLKHFYAAYNDRESWEGDYGSVGHWVAQFGMLALEASYAKPPQD